MSPVPQGGGGSTGGMGGGYGSGLSAGLTDRPKRPPLNPDPALFPVMGVMRRGRQGGGDQPGVVGRLSQRLSRTVGGVSKEYLHLKSFFIKQL